MHALEQLERLNPSRFNRLCIAFGFGCGLALVIDLSVVLSHGGQFQYVRHSVGFAAIALPLLWYVRLYRRALSLIAEGSRDLVKRYAPSTWNEQQQEKLLNELPYDAMAKRFAVFGMNAMITMLKRSLAQGITKSIR